MTELRPFKEIQLQWLRLLLADTSLSARAVQFATYLAVVRYNDRVGKAWPSHSTVAADLGLKSDKTVQRLIKELNGKWFEIKRGNGQKQSTEYVPSKATHLAAQELRQKEEAGKPDKIVHLRTRKGGHYCPDTRTKVSGEPGQKCPPIKEKEKTKEKRADARDLPDEGQSRTALRFVPASGSYFEREWNDRLTAHGFECIHRLLPELKDGEGRKGYLLPGLVPAQRDTADWIDQLAAFNELVANAIPRQLEGEAHGTNAAAGGLVA